MVHANVGQQLAIVIATKDRPVQLATLLTSIASQSRLPNQIVVVDGSDAAINEVLEDFPSLSIDYVRVYPPALTKQKNAGVAAVNPEISLIGILDDDIVLESESIKAMMSFWEQAPSRVGGAAFNLTGFHYSNSWLNSLSKRLFFMHDREFGKVLRSGFTTPIWGVSETKPVWWLGGGYTVWKREIFKKWRFDEWFAGSGLWEDVVFSYQVGAEYEFAVVAEARAAHMEGPISPRGQVSVGKKHIVNWMYFVNKNPELSKAMCLWACVGRTAYTLGKGIVKLDANLLMRALGNALGLATIISRPINRMAGRAFVE